MSLKNELINLVGRLTGRKYGRRKSQYRGILPSLEPLEDRTLLALVNISQTTLRNEDEGTIAVNLSDSMNIFAASNIQPPTGLMTRYSTDGGQTWQDSQLKHPPHLRPLGDPQAAFDVFGNLFLTYITPEPVRLVVVAASFNGGQTFEEEDFAVVSVGPGDQPAIATGPCNVQGQVVVMWRSVFDEGFGFSEDVNGAAAALVEGLGFVGEFSDAKAIPGSEGGYSGDVEVGPDGEIIATYMKNRADGKADIFVNTAAPLLPGPLNPFSAPVLAVTTNAASFTHLPRQGPHFEVSRRIDADPTLSWDRRLGSRNRLYLAYLDSPSPGSLDTNVYMVNSEEGGISGSWTEQRITVYEGPGTQFMPGMAVDQTTGNIAVAWLDTRGSVNQDNTTVETYATVSFSLGDEGTWRRSRRLSAGPPRPPSRADDADSSNNFGDYGTLDAHGGSFYYIWADNTGFTPENEDLLDMVTNPYLFNDFLPGANADIVNINEDVATLINVLGNDLLGGQTVEVTLETAPTRGTASVITSGADRNKISYSPNSNFHGTDTLVYKVTGSNGQSETGEVTITIASVNDIPVAANDTPAAFNEDSPTTITPLANDAGIGDGPFTVTMSGAPSNGTAVVNNSPNSNASAITITYTPNANFNGSDSFSYQVCDTNEGAPAECTIGTVMVTINPVNDPPVASNDSYTTFEDQPRTVGTPGVLENDTDPEGDTFTAELVANAGNGTVTLNADGSFTYVPNAEWSGTDYFTYRARDSHGAPGNIRAATVVVFNTNDPPVATNPGPQTTDEDVNLTITLESSDVDSASRTFHIAAAPTHGTLTVGPVTCTAQGAGSICTATATYDPALDYNGSDSFVFRARDGSLNTSNITVPITVNPVNDAPVANPDDASCNEDIGQWVSPVWNDTDVEGNPLTIIAVTQGSHGTVVIDTTTRLEYTPSLNYNGPDTFTYTISDGQGGSATTTINMTVRPVNDQPMANNDSYTAVQNTTLIHSFLTGVLANDTDVEGSALTTALVTTVSHGTLTLNPDGSFTYEPQPGFLGTDTFTYRAFDGQLASPTNATVTIDVVTTGTQQMIETEELLNSTQSDALSLDDPDWFSRFGRDVISALVEADSHR